MRRIFGKKGGWQICQQCTSQPARQDTLGSRLFSILHHPNKAHHTDYEKYARKQVKHWAVGQIMASYAVTRNIEKP